MSLYARVTGRGLSADEKGVAISALFAEVLRFQRGTRTRAQVEASLGLNAGEAADMIALLGKINSVAHRSRLSLDVERLVALLQYDEDLAGQGYGISSWAELLAEVDAWIATGAYD